MEFIKKIFKDDDKIVGLCAFKKNEKKIYSYIPSFTATKLVYKTDYEKNLFIL